MTITSTSLYWITRLDSIQCFFIGLIMITIVAITFFMISIITNSYDFDDFQENRKKNQAYLTPLFILLAISSICLVFIPSTKEMIIIKGLPVLVNSDLVQNKIPAEAEDLYKLSKDYLKSKLSDKK